MAEDEASRAVLTLLTDLICGSGREGSWILNPDDPGLLKSLDTLSAEQASEVPPNGGSSIAAHVDHVRYGMELLNRWSRGEKDAFENATWSSSWKRTAVSAEEWVARREALAREAHAWRLAMEHPAAGSSPGLDAMLASVAHLAYHLGAIRQINRLLRGPSASE